MSFLRNLTPALKNPICAPAYASSIKYNHKNNCITWCALFSHSNVVRSLPLPKKYSCSEFFWPVFSRIPTEYGKIPIRKTPNTDTFYAVCRNGLFQIVL